MWYLPSLERVGVIQKLTILEYRNGLVLSNTRVPVSWTWSILFPNKQTNKNNNEKKNTTNKQNKNKTKQNKKTKNKQKQTKNNKTK